jgi:uncharacterized lipoprotein YbaY
VLVKGLIYFEGGVIEVGGASVYVRLLDVSRADAASSTIAEYRITHLPAGTKTSETISFEIEAEVPDPRASLILAAHLDMNRDGEISIGDYITMESFPVSPKALSNKYTIKLRRISK